MIRFNSAQMVAVLVATMLVLLAAAVPLATASDEEGEGGEKEEPFDTVLCFTSIFTGLIVALAAGVLLVLKFIIFDKKEHQGHEEENHGKSDH